MKKCSGEGCQWETDEEDVCWQRFRSGIPTFSFDQNIYFTGWPVKHGRVFLVPCKKDFSSVQVYSSVHWTFIAKNIFYFCKKNNVLCIYYIAIQHTNIFALNLFGLIVCVHPLIHSSGEIWASRNGSGLSNLIILITAKTI